MTVFTVIGLVVVAAIACFGIYTSALVVAECISEHVGVQRGAHWSIESLVTKRSFTARFFGVSWVLRSGGPTRGFFYVKSDRDE